MEIYHFQATSEDVSSSHPALEINAPVQRAYSLREEVKSQALLTQTEKFELLSAYLDSEVTSEERVLVEHWLSSDPQVRSYYQKQLKLRAAIKSMLM